jgi:hypothetical protein
LELKEAPNRKANSADPGLFFGGTQLIFWLMPFHFLAELVSFLADPGSIWLIPVHFLADPGSFFG